MSFFSQCLRQQHQILSSLCRLSGGARPSRCALHKLGGQEDITSRRCDSEGCNKIPSFHLPGDKEKRRFCAAHKPPGFVDYHLAKRRCIVAPAGVRACNRSSSFGFKGGKRISCAQHKQKGEEACLVGVRAVVIEA